MYGEGRFFFILYDSRVHFPCAANLPCVDISHSAFLSASNICYLISKIYFNKLFLFLDNTYPCAIGISLLLSKRVLG